MSRPNAALTAVLLGAALVTAACAKDTTTTAPTADEDTSVGHIHGLGVDPADDSLYVATHFGLFHVDESGRPSRVADRYQDTMAFTVVGPGHFLGSGHPDLTEDLPAHLGLIESTDAGKTWTPLALQGEADFHILEPAGDALYAYDATSGRLLRTEDRKSFDEVFQGPLISVAAVDENVSLTATNGNGRLVSIDAGSGETRELGGPTMMYLDTTADGTLAGIDPNGVVQVSADARTWREVGSIDGQPAAFTISDQGWYAATETAVFQSSDDGETWSRVL
ncbi:exo-alpha-sialidase [Nocardioides glacieisoli]|uniref:Exo-alpha-sialidase n=1 Tax=Nocardioides glacieisoli TaxID=1168730 RepID=A0A4Q2RJR9_9ACTN|nr:sialidase family protein [Nocardioides glacieisoli]RYB88588.1 exo-alpha-sialidase [Nocardioides glacieisoli]